MNSERCANPPKGFAGPMGVVLDIYFVAHAFETKRSCPTAFLAASPRSSAMTTCNNGWIVIAVSCAGYITFTPDALSIALPSADAVPYMQQ